jgi:hypothetical protein
LGRKPVIEIPELDEDIHPTEPFKRGRAARRAAAMVKTDVDAPFAGSPLLSETPPEAPDVITLPDAVTTGLPKQVKQLRLGDGTYELPPLSSSTPMRRSPVLRVARPSRDTRSSSGRPSRSSGSRRCNATSPTR